MDMSTLKNNTILNAKNIIGWRTRRKIVIFSIDDYGNVRVDSKKAREQMDSAGLKVLNRFDAYDALETRQDLEALYEVLSSVKDSAGRPAVFTPFALPCNINYEAMEENGYEGYVYETLPETYRKLSAMYPESYEGAWEVWQEGIIKGMMVPQFHGREHLNLKLFEEKLKVRDHEVMTALKNRSYTSIRSTEYPTISPMAAFDFWKREENQGFARIIQDGLDRFEEVYGYRSVYFNPPGGREHPDIHKYLKKNGVSFIDAPLVKREHQGKAQYKHSINYTGKRSKSGLTVLVRNVVFEPTEQRGVDWVSNAMKQIEVAFRWNRPAIISSHRVNFCGHIDKNNRKKGLDSLKELLSKIVQRWPDVEFMSANQLGELVSGERKIDGVENY